MCIYSSREGTDKNPPPDSFACCFLEDLFQSEFEAKPKLMMTHLSKECRFKRKPLIKGIAFSIFEHFNVTKLRTHVRKNDLLRSPHEEVLGHV